MTMPRDPLSESFTVINCGDGSALVRHAVPRTGGQPYCHACPLPTFEAVAHAVEEAGDKGFTLFGLQASLNLPFTQIATAMAFLRERGIIEQRYPRRNYAISSMAHLDAMTEYHALREGDQA